MISDFPRRLAEIDLLTRERRFVILNMGTVPTDTALDDPRRIASDRCELLFETPRHDGLRAHDGIVSHPAALDKRNGSTNPNMVSHNDGARLIKDLAGLKIEDCMSITGAKSDAAAEQAALAKPNFPWAPTCHREAAPFDGSPCADGEELARSFPAHVDHRVDEPSAVSLADLHDPGVPHDDLRVAKNGPFSDLDHTALASKINSQSFDCIGRDARPVGAHEDERVLRHAATLSPTPRFPASRERPLISRGFRQAVPLLRVGRTDVLKKHMTLNVNVRLSPSGALPAERAVAHTPRAASRDSARRLEEPIMGPCRLCQHASRSQPSSRHA